ncbi:hypothetical protein DPMN_055932 [Dreissena polymorpha]|uniref:Uncharacterized protein n=1 Tax=Dreissena polymorpha TaxID=45954 RepID=A0A9D4HSQ6_DREPO|nr:hypothetical protein DPMN_055932 [Dreissena polymorpha]
MGRLRRSGSILDLDTLRVVGVFAFIGILLFMAGVEFNPGPFQVFKLRTYAMDQKDFMNFKEGQRRIIQIFPALQEKL